MSLYSAINPATGQTLRVFQTATDEDISAAVTSASDAFRDWSRKTSHSDRAALIRRVAEIHRDRREELAEILVQEVGKIIAGARGEIDLTADIYDYYADNAEEFLADEQIKLQNGSGSAIIKRMPVGPLLGIMPWNLPYYQVARFAGPNLIIGNTILLKHAPQCPQSAQKMADIFAEAGFPAGAYTNIFATNEQAAAIIADDRVQGVSLTGSERAGRAVAEVAGRNLKKVVLELGGSDPFIVMSTDDMEATVTAAADARLDNNGQVCNAAKRFIVADHLYDEFLEKFTAKMTGAKIGDPFDPDTVLSAMISRDAASDLTKQVDRAVEQGATLHSARKPDGAFYPGGVLTGITRDHDVYTQELFGPVAQVYKVSSEEEAINLANDIPFGLGSYLYTTDKDQAQRMADQLEAGMVWVNLVLGDSPELPFGGIKRSGFGRELGRFGAEEFVNKKLIRMA